MSVTQIIYSCEVKEIFSADDLIVLVDLGVENLWKRQRIRLAGVDAPNAINATGDTEAGLLRSHIRQLTRGRKAKLTVVSRNTSSWIAILVVETPEGSTNVNDYLIAKGYQFKRTPAPAVTATPAPAEPVTHHPV